MEKTNLPSKKQVVDDLEKEWNDWKAKIEFDEELTYQQYMELLAKEKEWRKPYFDKSL